jgi:carboxymethylenebutenolidase
MTTSWKTIDVGGSPMRVYLAVPDTPGPHPAVVIAQHAGGVDTQIQDTVHRFHREGYIAAAPELYHRQPAGIADNLARIRLLKDDEIIADINATVALVKKQPTAAALGMMGYCMGGRVAYLMACVNRDFKATAVFYGGNIAKPLGDGPSPFERSAAISAPLIAFTGAEDTNPSPEDMDTLSAELARLGKWHEFHRYNGAEHAFCNFITERYRPRAARAAWGELLAFYQEFLHP